MEIRQVWPEDREAWLRLRQLLWPDHPVEELEGEIDRLLRDSDRNSVFVALQPDRQIVGFLEASIRDWAEGCETEPVGYIEGWFVQAEHRRSGVGRKLVEAAEDWALSRGCTEMGSDTELWNELSQSAHRALGYLEATRLVCFHKTLRGRNGED